MRVASDSSHDTGYDESNLRMVLFNAQMRLSPQNPGTADTPLHNKSFSGLSHQHPGVMGTLPFSSSLQRSDKPTLFGASLDENHFVHSSAPDIKTLEKQGGSTLLYPHLYGIKDPHSRSNFYGKSIGGEWIFSRLLTDEQAKVLAVYYGCKAEHVQGRECDVDIGTVYDNRTAPSSMLEVGMFTIYDILDRGYHRRRTASLADVASESSGLKAAPPSSEWHLREQEGSPLHYWNSEKGETSWLNASLVALGSATATLGEGDEGGKEGEGAEAFKERIGGRRQRHGQGKAKAKNNSKAIEEAEAEAKKLPPGIPGPGAPTSTQKTCRVMRRATPEEILEIVDPWEAKEMKYQFAYEKRMEKIITKERGADAICKAHTSSSSCNAERGCGWCGKCMGTQCVPCTRLEKGDCEGSPNCEVMYYRECQRKNSN